MRLMGAPVSGQCRLCLQAGVVLLDGHMAETLKALAQAVGDEVSPKHVRTQRFAFSGAQDLGLSAWQSRA
jgi:hypothetical protein